MSSRTVSLRIVPVILFWLATIAVWGGAPHSARAQGVAQVTITGIPPVLDTPFPDRVEENFRSGRYQVIFNYTGSPEGAAFRFHFKLSRDGKQIVDVVSDPKFFTPGTYVFTSFFEDVPFPQSADDVYNQLDAELKKQVLQEGTIPEGSYTIQIQAEPEQSYRNIANPPAMAPFTVRYPQPPVLLSPSDESNVLMETPVFAWTPVVNSIGTSFSYHFLLVEVLDTQTPVQAVTANRALAEVTLTGQTTLPYTSQYLPLEKGHHYAWQVTAEDVNEELPLKDDGVSEINTFTYKADTGPAAEELLSSIVLQPDFARLINLKDLDVDEQGGRLVLNGRAVMQLDFMEPYRLPVQVENLVIQQSGEKAIVLDGAVTAGGERIPGLPHLRGAADIVAFNQVRWKYGEGVQATGKLQLPDGSTPAAEGWIQYRKNGLSGKLTANNPEGVASAGKDPVKLTVTNFEASFPSNQLFAAGRVEMFGGDVVCQVTQMNLKENQAGAVFSCPDDAAVTLVKDSARLRLLLDNLDGTLDYHFGDRNFAYDLTARGQVALGVNNGGECSAFMQVSLNDKQGFRTDNIQPTCSMYAPPLDLGFMKLKLDDINLNSIGYKGGGDWDFDLSLEGALTMPSMDGWVLPLTRVDVTSGGLRFPELDWDAPELGLDGPLTVDGFGIEPTHFNLPQFTFPWFSWSPDKGGNSSWGDWNFNIDFNFHFPDDWAGLENEDDDRILPPCITSGTIRDVSANFSKGMLSADLPATVLQDCRMDLADGYTFIIDKLGGRLKAEAGVSGMDIRSRLSLDARFLAGTPFNCGKDEPAQVGETDLTVDEQGLLDGRIKNIVDHCQAGLGPFEAQITQSDLRFSHKNGSQELVVDADGQLTLAGSQQVDGGLQYDVLNGRFNELDFKYDKPFLLTLPSENSPALSFLVEGLRLTKDGLLIDGRQQLLIGDARELSMMMQRQTGQDIKIPEDITAIGVTFDQALIGLSDFGIKSGRIIFDHAFALKAGIDPQLADINYQVAPADTSMSLGPNSAWLSLGSRIVMDKEGLHTKGRAEARVQVSDLKFNDLKVEFSRDFSMGVSPFSVTQGQADLSHENRRVAYINSSGFHLDPTYLTQAVPDTLALPTMETAYMVLRDPATDNLLVQARQESDGTYTMSTNSPVDLVIPALKGSQATAPEVAVTFTNITYDPASAEIISGSIEGDFNPAIDLNEFGVPFKVKRIKYGDGLTVNDQQFGGDRGLFLEGDILLYKTEISDNGDVALFLENGDHIRGDVDLRNLDADIPLVPQSNLAVLSVDSLGGSIDVPLDIDMPDVSLDMRGQFRLQRQDQTPVAMVDYFATYDNGQFGINAMQQPDQTSASGPAFVGPTGFRIDKINTLNLSYSSISNDFDFRSELDFSMLLKTGEQDTLEVPLHHTTITENGFTIPAQTINGSSTPALSAPPFTLGPAEMTLLEFRTLRDIQFNWFTGQGVPPAFAMDLAVNLDALDEIAPQASQASLTLDNVGYNQGVFTGTFQDYTFRGAGAPMALGGDTYFYLTAISGGLINTGTTDNPEQGYDISMAGNLDYPDFFGEPQPNCTNPTLNLKLSEEGGLLGSVDNVTPCGKLRYGPATLSFDPSSTLVFAFNNQRQSVVLDGSVNAVIEQQDHPNITATGNVEVDVVSGNFVNSSLAVDDLFTYEYPQSSPLFTFRVQHALLNQNGVVFTGDAGLTYPGSQDTARVRFRNFTIDPQDEGVTAGSFTIRDSLALEVGMNPMNWTVVDPSSDFTRDNAGRLLLAGGVMVDTDGISLAGSSTASVRAGGQSFPDLTVDYTGFRIGLNPAGVDAGRADLSLASDQSSFGYIDKDRFHVDLPGLITSVLPDTLNLPDRQTAYLVLGDGEGDRYALEDGQSPRRLHTLPGKTVELVIPSVRDASNDTTFRVQVAFDVEVDNFMRASSGSVSLQNRVDLEPFLNIPLGLDSLNYSSNTGELRAAASVILPQSLNGAELKTTAVIGSNGFQQGTISAGQYSEIYLPSQENVTPIASDSLGNGALAFYVRGLELEFGQTNSLAISGQLKSNFLKDSQGTQTPIHYAASYNTGQWAVSIDEGNLSNGIDLGYARIEPAQNPNQGLFNVTMNRQEFAVAFSGVVSMPEVLGDGFSLEVQQFRLSTVPDNQGRYVTVSAQQNLPDQQFNLFGGALALTSTNTSVSFSNGVLAIGTSGSFDFYNKQDLNFQDLVFRSDGSVDIGGVGASLLDQPLELLPDSSLVLDDLSLSVVDNALQMDATGFATLPKPLDERAAVTITANTNGDVDVAGPDFIFDSGFQIGNNAGTEYAVGTLATLELTGLGVDLDIKNPGQSSLYAAGVVYMENKTDKRIMFGDAGNLQQDPGIKYSINDGVEWNVSSSFDPNSSPLSFKYDFFNISVSSIQVNTDVTVDGETVPFQAEIGGLTGLNVAGVSGEVGFAGFKFSTKGVDDIGRIDGGGTFTLMDIVSLELGGFEYKTAEQAGHPFTLQFAEGSGSESGTSVDTVDVTGVTKYLHFTPGPGGNALRLSLTDGIAGGVQEVLYYQVGTGSSAERYFKIKNASLKLSDQAQLAVGMELVTKNGNFDLSVAGGGHFASVGIAAAGNISTLQDQLHFGIFVAASAPINFMGIMEINSFGGGFYYRPTQDNLDMTIDAIKALSGGEFHLNGQQPVVQNLQFAALLYGGITIGGTSGASAISANALIQITDQFTKIDANGTVFNQGDKFEAGLYLTILYTPEIAGVEGGVNMNIKYDPVMTGDSQVDFFATKDRTSNDPVLWGIDGHFQLMVINYLDVDGTLLVSPDGLLMELGAGSGFDVAVISANSSFDLTVWYLPDYRDPLGVYGKFSISFSICKGLADFDASVEGGYFDRGSYKMLYFAGEAHVSVLFVIDANVRGWVKFQTKNPHFDYGRGGSAELEQMIADAKDRARGAKDKAEETKNELENAKDQLNQSLTDPTQLAASAADLRKAGFNLLASQPTTHYTVDQVYNGEQSLRNTSIPAEIQWIKENVMDGYQYNGSLPGSFNGYDMLRPIGKYLSGINPQAKIQVVENQLPTVKQRLETAKNELSGLANEMQSNLESDQPLGLSSPVTNVQGSVTGANGELLSAPSFRVDSAVADSNSARLNRFESELAVADARYRQAILAATGNVELVDLVLEGKASIQWDVDNGVQLGESQGVSVNALSKSFIAAREEVRKYNANNLAEFWDTRNWAAERLNYITSHKGAIEDFWTDYSWGNRKYDAKDVVVDMKEAIAELKGGGQVDENQINTTFTRSETNAKALYDQTAEEFWYTMPKLGLTELRDNSARIADSLSQAFDTQLQALNDSHVAFTQSVDDLYSIKSQMLVTIYGMIEEYNAWKKEAFGMNSSAPDLPTLPGGTPQGLGSNGSSGLNIQRNYSPFMTDKLQVIESALAPPTIEMISGGQSGSSFYRSDTDYFGIAELSFTASHPMGVPELSVNLSKGTVNNIYTVNNYYTAGVYASSADTKYHKNSGTSISNLQFYYPKTSLSQTSQALTGAVRARGFGGTKISRLVNFTIPVAPGGTSTSGSVRFGDDTTPPTKPVVVHDYESYNNRYWTPDSSMLCFTFKSADRESDVRLYKYKLGTTPGGDDVRGWTDAQGTRGEGMEASGYQQVNTMFGSFMTQTYSFTSKLVTEIRGLNLQRGTDYYLSVKAVNGDNMESAVKNVALPFRYEPSTPTKPKVTVTNSIESRQQPNAQPVVHPAAETQPGWEYSHVNTDRSSSQGQQVTISWSSGDTETGVQGFSVGDMRTADASADQVFRADDVDFIESDVMTDYTYSPSFTHERYWYVRARNNVGMKSSMTVVGPIRNKDISPPTTPGVQVQAAADGFYVYITRLADDAQTGIRGYQYAVTGENGADTLRSWPDPQEVDFEQQNRAGSQAKPPVYFVPWSSFMQAGTYNISVRAVNGQDMVSQVVTNTGVMVDTTPPERTVFSVKYGEKPGLITFSINQIGDPESGIESVRYEVLSKMSAGELDAYMSLLPSKDRDINPQPAGEGMVQLDSGTLQEPEEGRELNISLPKLEFFAPALLRITVRNTMGLERSNTETIEIPPALIEKARQQKEKLMKQQEEQQKKETKK